MHRRSFLKTAAAVIPCAGLHDVLTEYAHAQAPAPSPANALHVVGAGEDRFHHPIAMGFSTLLFKVTAQETAGGLFLIEHKNLGPSGPPLHMHLSQEEWFYVMEGRVVFQVGEQRIELGPGESVLAPRRVPHTFAGAGSTPAHMLIAFCPAGKMEGYFRAVEGAAKPPAHPAEFFRQFDVEYIGPSPFAKA